MRWRGILVCLLVLLQATVPVFATPPRIGVVTMQPGEVFFERFGHDALVVFDPESEQAVAYNFGYFDPDEPGFISNFIRGRMYYYLVALPLEQDLRQYQLEGRGVSIQWLNLTPAQAQQLAQTLAIRALPENARYRYDYFTANCATMVRDQLNAAMDGQLYSQLAARSGGATYRSEAVRLARPTLWMWLGFDLGLGPWADRPLSRWDEAFIPMRLAESLREVRTADGQPLVSDEMEWLPHRIAPEPEERRWAWWPWLIIGLALAAAITALARHQRRVLGWLALGFWLISGLSGLLLLYLWGWSEHQAAWANRNILLLNPLTLLLLPLGWRWLRKRGNARWATVVAWIVAALAGLCLPLYWLSSPPQANIPWILIVLPLHLALAYAATYSTTTPPPAITH